MALRSKIIDAVFWLFLICLTWALYYWIGFERTVIVCLASIQYHQMTSKHKKKK